MLPYQMIAGGRFTLNATTVTGVNVPLVGMGEPDFVICRSITGWGEASDAQAIQWCGLREWHRIAQEVYCKVPMPLIQP